MAKPEWAICEVSRLEDTKVLETFVDRDKCANELRKRRDALEGKAKWSIAMLPLDKKGNYLLPP